MTRMSCTIFTPVLLVMVKVIQGQVAVKGHCPEVTTVDNFDVRRYSGVWYEQKRLFFLIEGNGICVNATYTPQEDGTVQVLNQNYNPEQQNMTQESEVLSMLEARMSKLEACIVGSPPNLDSQTSGNTVCDSLLHTNTLVATALSGREKVRDVTESSGRLEKLTLVLLDSKTRADGTSDRVMGLIEQYNAIIHNLTLTFEHWDNVLTRAELSRQSKKEID
uniref:Lipocalin/cytosolic fatty-acid binding domain-containing protein n=1 Tax=Timema tahoe TaxID=61484 RepID=A0A7R9NZB8_9NEOP|nr:unnamed protein product [Timema tahoe]